MTSLCVLFDRFLAYPPAQVQHVVDAGLEPEVPIIEPSQPSARLAFEIFQKMDLDQDGKVLVSHTRPTSNCYFSECTQLLQIR